MEDYLKTLAEMILHKFRLTHTDCNPQYSFLGISFTGNTIGVLSRYLSDCAVSLDDVP